MGKVYEKIDDKITDWISKQKIFFVASAPLSSDGLINCSPKGLDTFRILDPQTIAYLDYTGSGAETLAHIRENKRLVIMMCAFEGQPKIFRFHGTAEAIEIGMPEFDELASQFDDLSGARSIIVMKIDRISDSCGFSVPMYEYKGSRDGLGKWAKQKGESGVLEYQRQNNAVSLDGLPALRRVNP